MIVETCKQLRADALTLQEQIRSLKGVAQNVELDKLTRAAGQSPPDRGEMVANAMLALRHVEDARMRLGKVIQAFDGGTSCYPA